MQSPRGPILAGCAPIKTLKENTRKTVVTKNMGKMIERTFTQICERKRREMVDQRILESMHKGFAVHLPICFELCQKSYMVLK